MSLQKTISTFLGLVVTACLFLPGECPGTPLNPEDKSKLQDAFRLIRLAAMDPCDRNRRKEILSIIQNACSKVPARVYNKYMQLWDKDSALADSMELSYCALGCLRKCVNTAIEEIAATEVKQGVAVWHFYNMGYVFKTPYCCFGIDLHCRDAEKLEKYLDFLLVTHLHHDHVSEKLMDAMIAANKLVITRGYAGSVVVKDACEINLRAARIKIDIGDHHRHLPLISTNNMLMFQIACNDEAGGYTIYHSGDGNGIRKMTPDKAVDIFVAHVQLPMPLEKAVNHINPRMTLVSHVMELSHSEGFPAPMRWTYDYAFRKMKAIPEDKAIVLTWGERWLFPGTKIAENGAK
jgi:predicted metal-binding protein